MKRALITLVVAALLLLPGCSTISPPSLLTKTEQGQPVTKTEPRHTGDRANVPVDVKPEDVVAHVKTKSGAETWVDKKGNVYQNDQAKKENAGPPDRPKRSWAWAWWTGGFLGALALIDRLLKSFVGINPLGALCGLVIKLFKGLSKWRTPRS